MKKLFLLFLLIMVCLPSFADDEDKKSESLTVAFKDKSGSLIQESRFEVGKVGSIQFDVIIFTDILKGDKVGSLRITTSDSRYNYFGYLDSDEIDDCIQSLIYIRDNVLTTPIENEANYSQVAYKSRDRVGLGVTNYGKKWTPYINAHTWDKDSRNTYKAEDIDNIINFFKQSKELIKSKLQ